MDENNSFFCEKCGTKYDITTEVNVDEQDGGDNKADIIQKLLNNQEIKLTQEFIKKYSNINEYKNLSNKDKKKINKIVKDHKNLKNKIFNKFYLKCQNCLFYKELQSGTVIYKNDYIYDDNVNVEDLTYKINDPLLIHFKGYICKNDKCETHKNKNLKDAVLIPNRETQINIYICTVCKTQVLL